MKSFYRIFLKRLFDILFSLLVLVTLSPIFLIITLLIKAVSPNGPIFFVHQRLGLNGKTFDCLKFRTMIPDAQNQLSILLKNNPILADEFSQTQKLKDDPRIIPLIGSFLRRTSMDELPQFINVLRNHMSVIGPRPITHAELAHYTPYESIFLSIKPGITGLWQTSGRNDITYNQRVRLDLQYIEQVNLFLDLKIVFKTLITIIRGSGY